MRHLLKALKGQTIKVSAIISRLELFHNNSRGDWKLLLLDVKLLDCDDQLLTEHLWIDCKNKKSLIQLGSKEGEEIRFYGTVVRYITTRSGSRKENYTLQFHSPILE